MPDATITSTASTFGTISGVFSADQSTISGTISGIVPGTLTGSVGVPGPAGPGVPAGGTSGQFLQKTSGVDYATDWVTVNLTGLATESWVTAGFYPLTGNPSSFLTASALTPYLTSATAASTYQTLAGMSAYLTKADNLGSLTNFATARDNLGLGSLSTPTFAGVNVPGSGTSVANLGSTSLTINQQGSGQFTIQPSQGIVFPDASVQTTAFTTAQLTAYLVKASNLSDLTSASSARTNLGLGSLAVVNDAPSDGSQYARKNGAWDVVTTTPDYITSVSSPLSVTTGNLTIDLSAYLTSATAATTYAPIAAGLPDNGVEGQILVKQSATAYDAEWQDNFATELRMPARNETGATLTKGTVVYISGGAGNKPLLAKALATGDSTSAQTIGLVTADIPNNSNGDVTIRGQLKDLDTSAFSVGAQLYLSGTTAGAFTATKTLAPTHLVYVGIVVRSNATEGAIEVAVQNGYELGEIHDVSIGTLANNDLLAYESSTDLWKNKTYSALGLLTSASAASTYQTLSGMSDYLTTSAASSTYYPLTNPDNYLTSYNASFLFYPLSSNPAGYLTSAPVTSVAGRTGAITLANTDISGLGTMSTATAADYSTTTVANGLYYPLSSNPAGYLTTAPVTSVAGKTGAVTLVVGDVSGAAPTASPTLTGTPLSTTAAADTNTTQIATTAFVVGQAGSASPVMDGSATVGTSLRYARQDHVHPTDTSRAPLASPALTGTPTAPTASTGTNTTQIATTAFVQQEVPDFATTSEIMSPSSTTKVLSPFDAVRMITNRAFFDTKAATGSFNTSGTGAEAYKATNDRLIGLGTPNAGIAGHGQHMFDTTAGSWGILAAKRGSLQYTQDWSKKIFASGTAMFYAIGDSATTARVMIGGKAAFGAGSPTKQSIGWKLVGGGSNALVLVTYGYNGTSSVVTETTSSFTPVLNQSFDWFIYHEPNVSTPSLSKCYLYVNDNLVATGQNSPADATINFNYFLEGCESTGSHATRMAFWSFPTMIWWSRS